MNALNRRRFLTSSAGLGLGIAGGALGLLDGFRSVSAAEARLEPRLVRLSPEIEPLVRLLEETPRERLLEEVGWRVRHGLSYQHLLAALLLAGVRNVEPRPVGFKFHAVLVVNSAHLASLASPDSDRWLPIFWALDYFKDSQARNQREGDWRLGPVDESRVPAPEKARDAFMHAMDRWDPEAADTAVAGLARSAGAHEIFDLFARYGARDYRDIGHKGIYVANAWRTLQCIGWHHAEPVLRSLAYALLEHDGGNPAERDAVPDRPWRVNTPRAESLPPGWTRGRRDPDAARDLVRTLRDCAPEAASAAVVESLQEGIDPASIWDGLFAAAGELLMERPGIVALHAVTTANAMRFAWDACSDDPTRRMLLLQYASFLPMFRGEPMPDPNHAIDTLTPASPVSPDARGAEAILARISEDRSDAARQLLGYLEAGGDAGDLMNRARRLIFLKGTNSHDYKFSSAVLEDFHHLDPRWRNRFLAASVFRLRGSGDPDNGLVDRIRASL